jgi:hypothetical protein
MYSTDAIFAENRKEAEEKNVPLGFIQVRKSKDLVHWDFVGWAFPEIPAPALGSLPDALSGYLSFVLLCIGIRQEYILYRYG